MSANRHAEAWLLATLLLHRQANAATLSLGIGGNVAEMGGVVIVAAGSLDGAVRQVKLLGCRVTYARSLNSGKYALDVQMDLRAANALAYAVARREADFRRHEQFSAALN